MQCNTNYTADKKNYKYINLNVLNQYKKIFKDKVIYGLSDHTFGSETVLGAISLGARVIEKHFTDDNLREGPDHKFSMIPKRGDLWLFQHENSRTLGDGQKNRRKRKNNFNNPKTFIKSISINIKRNPVKKRASDCTTTLS